MDRLFYRLAGCGGWWALGLSLLLFASLSAAGAFRLGRAEAVVPDVPSTNRYVATTGSDTGNGCTSLSLPCATIGHAVSVAGTDDVISVAAGLYCEHVTIGINLAIQGGFNSTFTAQTGGTLVDGEGNGSPCSGTLTPATVFTINSGVGVTLAGLTVQHGSGAIQGGGIANSGTLTLTNATVSSNTSGFEAGGIENAGTAILTNVTVSGNMAGPAGGINNDGTLTLTNVTISGNTASGTFAYGGGILNSGTATLTNVTLSGNTATSGGGIFNNPSGTATLTNVTVSGNTAGAGGGGGIGNEGTANLINVTVSGNSAPSSGGGGIENNSGTTTLQGTIIAGNSGGNCANTGTLSSKGGNVADDASCNLTKSSDLASTNPLLGPLANNGGFTQTMALQPGSPAIDHVPTSLCPPPPTDQRGVTRPQGPACDSGAYEVQVTAGGGSGGGGSGGGGAPPPAATPTPTPSPTPTLTPSPTPSPTPSATPSPTPTPGCGTVSYAAGWNLAAGPSGTLLAGAAGSLFTFQASDTSYETFPTGTALSGGVGVWAFFFTPTTVTLPCVTSTTQSILLPANHFIMAGNPFDRPATLSGAQVVDTFNPATNSYTTATGTVTLGVGQGAWVFSSTGGTLTITSM